MEAEALEVEEAGLAVVAPLDLVRCSACSEEYTVCRAT